MYIYIYVYIYIYKSHTRTYIHIWCTLQKPADRHGLVVGCESSEFRGSGGSPWQGSKGGNTLMIHNRHGVQAGGLFHSPLPSGNW